MAYSRIQQANEPLEHESAPSPRSIPRTLRDHVKDNLRSATGNNYWQPEDPLANIPPPVGEDVAMQGRLQDPHYTDVVHYDMPVPVGYYHHPQPGDPAVPYMHHNAGVAQDIPVQPQAIQVQGAPEIQGHHIDYGPQLLVPGPGPARAELPDPWAHNAPVHDYPPADTLRRLARHYLDDPNSQVDMVRMEPGHAGRFKVVITLEMADFL